MRRDRRGATLDDGTAVPCGIGLHVGRIGTRNSVFHEGGTTAFSS